MSTAQHQPSPSPSGTAVSAARSSSSKQPAPAPSLLSVPHAELFFPLPVTTSIENVVLVKNTQDFKVLYRVRSTNKDKVYIVRPRFGKLHPGEDLKLRIILNHEVITSKKLPTPTESTKDRFVIESRKMLPHEEEEEKEKGPNASSVEQLWKNTSTTSSSNAPPTTLIELPCRFSAIQPPQVVVKESTKGKLAAAAAAGVAGGAAAATTGAGAAAQFMSAQAKSPTTTVTTTTAPRKSANGTTATPTPVLSPRSEANNQMAPNALLSTLPPAGHPTPPPSAAGSFAAPVVQSAAVVAAKKPTGEAPLPKGVAPAVQKQRVSSSSLPATLDSSSSGSQSILHAIFLGSVPVSVLLPLIVLSFLVAVSW